MKCDLFRCSSFDIAQRKSMTLDASLMSPSKSTDPTWNKRSTAAFEEALKPARDVIHDVTRGYLPVALKLLVALSAIISTDEYRRLGAALWDHGFKHEERGVSPEVCFSLHEINWRADTDG
jgi:hypothetical protein